MCATHCASTLNLHRSVLISLQRALPPSLCALDILLDSLQTHVVRAFQAVLGLERLVKIEVLHPEACDHCDGGDDCGHDVQRPQGAGVGLAHCVTLGAGRGGFHPVHESGGVGCQSVGAVDEVCVSAEVDYKATGMLR
jgi:hypothetical protein